MQASAESLARITFRYVHLHARHAQARHLQWNKLGYPAVYPFESITEYKCPNVHTEKDTSTMAQVRLSLWLHMRSDFLTPY